MPISIITASFNSLSTIHKLAESLIKQSSNDFEWIVIDGASTDGTVDFFNSFCEIYPWCKFSSSPDFGVYDAINRGVRLIKYSHYLTVGSDDYLYNDAVEHFNDALDKSGADVVLSKVNKGGRISGGFNPKLCWLGHQFVFRGSHSVGMLIKKSLHDRYGYYSNRFPILADGFFLKRLLMEKDVSFKNENFVAGFFSVDGVSNTIKLQTLAESWQIQMLTEKHKIFQLFLFFIKVIIKFRYLIR